MAGITDTPNALTAGAWAADFIAPRDLMPGGDMVDVAQFFAQDSVLVEATAQANIGAVAITVKALPGAIPINTLLDFGGAGAKPAKLTAAAAAGATSLTVATTLAQINVGDTARYAGAGLKKKVIQSGTIVGRTTAERIAGTKFGPAVSSDNEIFIVAFDKPDLSRDNSVDLVRPGFAVYENRLPDWTAMNTAQAEKQTVTITGTLSAGTFTFRNDLNGETSTPVAFNANLATIQAALDEIYGATNSVAAGTIASFTITFAVALAGVDMPPIVVTPDGVTGLTGINVAETVEGGKPILDKLRQLYDCTTGYN